MNPTIDNYPSYMVEVLKQPPYSPLPVEKQILMIFAGANGYLDDIPVSSVTKFEAELYPFVEANFPEVFEQLRDKKKIDDEIEALMKKALEEFKTSFSA